MAAKLSELLADLKEEEAITQVEGMLAQGGDPLAIMAEARDGMRLVGEPKYGAILHHYFLPRP